MPVWLLFVVVVVCVQGGGSKRKGVRKGARASSSSAAPPRVLKTYCSELVKVLCALRLRRSQQGSIKRLASLTAQLSLLTPVAKDATLSRGLSGFADRLAQLEEATGPGELATPQHSNVPM